MSPSIKLLFRTFLTLSVLSALNGALAAPGKKAPEPAAHCLLRVAIHIDPAIDSALVPNFSRSLYGALEQKFTNINLCVATAIDKNAPAGHEGVDLRIGYEAMEDRSMYHGSIVVYFKKTGDEHAANDETNQVLTLFQIPAGIDRDGLYMVVAEKIVENVRREVLGEVKVTILPEGAFFILDSALGRNRSPKTLLLLPGTYTLRAWLPKYVPYHQEIKVTAPGVTDVKATLKRRYFYHSRYLPLALFFGAASAGAFTAEHYYFRQYMQLGEDDFINQPEKFQNLFDRAKSFEFTGYTLLGLAAAGITVTFFF
ncbi:MAG: PEGA domain-containing protein [Chitinispirillaceae bacterium]|nr:PEGA domain-containing protein [Chitinispirillaceae bacterium]